MKKIFLSFILFSICDISYSQDTIPPALVEFAISPQIIDVTNSPKTIVITFTITDNFSGTSGSSPIIYFPNSGGFSTGATLISGTNLNGIWSLSIPVTNAIMSGIATVSLGVSDNVGNYKSYTSDEIVSLGFDSDFEIINTSILDTLPPNLIDLQISPKIIDVSDTSQMVEVTFILSDDQSGAAGGNPEIHFPNLTGYSAGATIIDGTPMTGKWLLNFTVPFAMKPGRSYFELSVYDIAGNYKHYSIEELQALGFDTDIEIINTKAQDTVPPQLVDLIISPQIIDISDTTKFVSITFSVKDNISGVTGATPYITFPIGGYGTGATLVSGTDINGIWSLTLSVPRGMPAGLAYLNGISVYDLTGNFKDYTYEELIALGFDPDIEIVYSTFRIKGESIFDGDNNGCSSQDLRYPSLKFNVKNGILSDTYISSTAGKYFLPVLEGVNTITPAIIHPDLFEISPSSFEINIPSISDTIIQNFCITSKGILNQVDLSIIPLTPPARPGFDAQYKVVMTNKGNQVENGILYFSYDEIKMDFVSTDVIPSNQSDGLISWDFTDLLPFETRYYNVILNVNSPSETPPVNAGDELLITCNILDNVFLLKQEVVGSYDPNDKTCLEGKTIAPEKVGDYVHYLIRFENTGNFYAENVRIEDVIDETTFDISTLEITDASHEAWARINGNIVEFIFENIQLPFDDASNDGYICFKIKTKPTLVLGNELKNEANIYFDYNLPILTNKTNTVVAIPVGTDEALGESGIEIFPNPVSDVLKFSGDDKVLKVQIFDMSGRLVQVSNVEDREVNVERLLSGAYQMKVYTQNGVSNGKMVKL